MAKPMPFVSGPPRSSSRETVIAAANADGVLQTESFGSDFECRVEAADETPVFFVINATQVQFFFELGIVGAAVTERLRANLVNWR